MSQQEKKFCNVLESMGIGQELDTQPASSGVALPQTLKQNSSMVNLVFEDSIEFLNIPKRFTSLSLEESQDLFKDYPGLE